MAARLGLSLACLLLQDETFRALLEWEGRFEPDRHQVVSEVGRWICTESRLKRFEPPVARKISEVTAGDGTYRARDESGVREFEYQKVGGKLVSLDLKGLPWPGATAVKGERVDEKEVSRSDPAAAVKSLLRLRAEVNRRLEARLGELDRLMPRPALPDTVVLSQDADRRTALVYLAHPLRLQGEEPEYWVVRVRLVRRSDGWRVEEEGIYCPDCPGRKSCGTCDGRGVMIIGDNKKILCNGCKPSGECKTCGGAGYRTRFSLWWH
jgi:hypothetical protein